MKTIVLASASVPDEYFGNRTRAFLVYDPDTLLTYEVYPFGHMRSVVPLAVDEEEARWLLKNHPAAQRRYEDIEEELS